MVHPTSLGLPDLILSSDGMRVCQNISNLPFPGGNAGIGKETAVNLAMRGARVIIACRDVDKARKAVREIKARSHNMDVLYMELDLANMKCIREFCASFLKKEKRLDILINNAGELFNCMSSLTER